MKLLILLVLLTTTALAQPPAQVGVDVVRMENASQTVPVLGRLVSRQRGVIAARTDGPVAQVRVQVGDRVAAGDALVVLDTARLQSAKDLADRQLVEFGAQIATAAAQEDLAAKELDRFERLRNSPAFSPSDYDVRLQAVAVARGQRQEAEARRTRWEIAIRLAEINLVDATVRAPFEGVVLTRHVSEGAWLQAGDSVVTLLNDRDLEIEADVPTAYLAGLTVGTPVDARLLDGTTVKATVRSVIPDQNTAARTQAVRFAVNLRELTRPAVNQEATLAIPAAAQETVVSVNKDALIYGPQGSLVFVVDNGVAQPRPVQIGPAMGSRFQILDGLKPGDRVVIRGNERLRPGQAVVVQGDPS